jgi:hypothetical protein
MLCAQNVNLAYVLAAGSKREQKRCRNKQKREHAHGLFFEIFH